MRSPGRDVRPPVWVLALLVAGTLLAFGVGPVVFGQQATPPQTPSQPVFRAGVNVVRVDVIVTDRKGNPVSDLTAADFDVTEDGKPQEISTFRFVLASGQLPPGEDAPRPVRGQYDEESAALEPGVRVFVIFMDEYHIGRLRSTIVARDAIARFLRTQIGPADLAGIMYPYTSIRDLRLTRDHEALAREILKFEGRLEDTFPRHPFEQEHQRDIVRLRNEVVATGLEALVTHLGVLGEGRKSVIFVSEGFQSRTGFMSVMSPDDQDLYRKIVEIGGAANRTNVAIYPVEPRGLMATLDGPNLRGEQGTLRMLADETDGVAIVNRNDLDGALREVTRDASAYYLLGYNSTNNATDGKYREIKVKVRRPGLHVRARKGYAGLTADEARSLAAPPPPEAPAGVLHAMESLSVPPGGRSIVTWVGFSRGEDGRPRATFAWEPRPGTASSESPQVTLVARGRDSREFFRGPVAPDARAGQPGAARGPSQVTFAVEPGRLDLAVQIAAGETEQHDLQQIAVPDPSQAPIWLDTPRVFRSRNALQAQRIRAGEDTPAAVREFSRTDRLIVRGTAFAAGAAPEVTAKLLNRLGIVMRPVPVTRGAGGTYDVDLVLSILAPADYLLEITARTPDGATATELVGFRVS